MLFGSMYISPAFRITDPRTGSCTKLLPISAWVLMYFYLGLKALSLQFIHFCYHPIARDNKPLQVPLSPSV
jgi:hypothetical protein